MPSRFDIVSTIASCEFDRHRKPFKCIVNITWIESLKFGTDPATLPGEVARRAGSVCHRFLDQGRFGDSMGLTHKIPVRAALCAGATGT